MKSSIKKLRQSKGASLIIALVFMLFCIFVGGSVLASAAANSARLKRTIADDQDYLNVRSAAVLLADEMRGSKNGTQLSFDVTLEAEEAGTSEEEVIIEGDEPVLETKLSCILTSRRTYARDQFYYCAACQYYNLHQGQNCVSYETDYPVTGTIGAPQEKWPLYAEQYKDSKGTDRSSIEIPVTFSFTPKGQTDAVTLDALMVCGGSSLHGNDNDYNIFVYFLNGSEINDKLHIEMTVGRLYDEADDIFFVTWTAPRIVKGGR